MSLSCDDDDDIPNDLEELSDSDYYSTSTEDSEYSSSESPVVVRKTRNSPKKNAIPAMSVMPVKGWNFAIKEKGDFSDYGILSKISDGKFGDEWSSRLHNWWRRSHHRQ